MSGTSRLYPVARQTLVAYFADLATSFREFWPPVFTGFGHFAFDTQLWPTLII
jgi:hypothetical protein